MGDKIEVDREALERWRDRIGERINPSKPWSCFPDTAKETEAIVNPPATPASAAELVREWHVLQCTRRIDYTDLDDLTARIDRHTDDAMRDALRMCDARHKAIERQRDDALAEIDAMRAVMAAASTWCGATTDPPAVRDFGAAGELVWSVYRYRKAMAKGKA